MKIAVRSEQVNDSKAIAIRNHRLSFGRGHNHHNRSESLEYPIAEIHLAERLRTEGCRYMYDRDRRGRTRRGFRRGSSLKHITSQKPLIQSLQAALSLPVNIRNELYQRHERAVGTHATRERNDWDVMHLVTIIATVAVICACDATG